MKLIIFSLLFSFNTLGIDFNKAIEIINNHDEVQILEFKRQSIKQLGLEKSSWGDPMVKVSAKNYPVDTLKSDQTPMTGIEFGLSQKISLTNKSSNIKGAFDLMSESINLEKQEYKRILIKELWILGINKDQLLKDKDIIKDNIEWVKKLLKISKKLYSNGRISQQVLFDFQIRKSELESSYEAKDYQIKELDSKVSYLLNLKSSTLNDKTFPWHLLDSYNLSKTPKELSFEKKIRAKELQVVAKKKNLIPDVTFSVGYTKRSNIDNRGDFASASIVFPLPFSDVKHSSLKDAIIEKESAIRSLYNFKSKRDSKLEELDYRVRKLQRELDILKEKTIVFAQNSRDISAKSYSVGKASYLEVLNSELKLQALQIQRNGLEAMLRATRLEKKFISGDKLND
jgi:cobalt-zinc-cadmium efflux system outer membrane protein